MLTLPTDSLSVVLEAKNPRDKAQATLHATLQHMGGEIALLHIAAADASHLVWGTQVRFQIGKGQNSHQVTGMVVGPKEAELSDIPEDDTPREVIVQLWECLPTLQRRSGPRRRARFMVRYLPLSPENDSTLTAQHEWLRAWCVDLGAGGMRLHLARPLCVPDKLVVRFSLPLSAEEFNRPPRREFQIQGRVLRCTAYGRHGDHVEMAVSFQRLSVEDSLALSAFLGK